MSTLLLYGHNNFQIRLDWVQVPYYRFIGSIKVLQILKCLLVICESALLKINLQPLSCGQAHFRHISISRAATNKIFNIAYHVCKSLWESLDQRVCARCFCKSAAHLCNLQRRLCLLRLEVGVRKRIVTFGSGKEFSTFTDSALSSSKRKSGSKSCAAL